MQQYAGVYLLQNYSVNKHLHTVASRWILLIQSHDARNHEYKIHYRSYVNDSDTLSRNVGK